MKMLYRVPMVLLAAMLVFSVAVLASEETSEMQVENICMEPVEGGNQPPVLEDIPDYTINELQPFEFYAHATDNDGPQEDIRFHMNQQIPGTTINYLTGRFSWTPTEAQGPGLYHFVVTVTDSHNGQDSGQFDIRVREVLSSTITIADSAEQEA